MDKNISGLFEIHLTVKESDHYLFRQYCWDKGIKPIHIILNQGVYTQQLMLSKYKNGSETDAINRAMELKKDLEKEKMTVIRTKVEAMSTNKNVPEDKCEEGNYFEFHFKCVIRSKDQLAFLDQLCGKMCNENYAVGLSFNNIDEDFRPITTIRVYNVGSKEATAIKDLVVDTIKEAGFVVNDRLDSEFVVYDDYPGLDEGWINKKLKN
jgi:hypothetical protein